MRITFTDETGLLVQGEWISLESIFPVINGKMLTGCQVFRLIQGETAFALQYTGFGKSDEIFTIEVVPEGQERCRLRFHIKNFSIPLYSFGVYISEINNLKLFLRNGLSSSDGCWYEEPENFDHHTYKEVRPILSFGMTQLIPRFGTGSLTLGFERHDRYQHAFTFYTEKIPIALSIEAIWDLKPITSGESCSSEWLDIFDHNEIEGALRAWSQTIADTAPFVPRISEQLIHGWCVGDEQSMDFEKESLEIYLRANQKASDRYGLPMKLCLLKGNFFPELGDWLEVKTGRSHTPKTLLNMIRAVGFIPGLWIAPFLVGNRSNLFLHHPDWMLHDLRSRSPVLHKVKVDECQWEQKSNEYYILDSSHPDAFEYLRRVFRTWKQDWGCDYFNTDYMDIQMQYAPEQVRYSEPGKSRIEIWYKLARMIREEIGNSTWMGSRMPLWESTGLVDVIQLGNDIDETGDGNSNQRFPGNLMNLNFTNNTLWQINLGCINFVPRNRFSLEDEATVRLIFTGLTGGAIIASNHFGELDPSLHILLKIMMNTSKKQARLPLMGKSSVIYRVERNPLDDTKKIEIIRQELDPVTILVRASPDWDGPHIVLIYNSSNRPVQRSFPFESLGVNGPFFVYDWGEFKNQKSTQWHIQVTLKPHEWKLVFLSKQALLENLTQLP